MKRLLLCLSSLFLMLLCFHSFSGKDALLSPESTRSPREVVEQAPVQEAVAPAEAFRAARALKSVAAQPKRLPDGSYEAPVLQARVMTEEEPISEEGPQGLRYAELPQRGERYEWSEADGSVRQLRLVEKAGSKYPLLRVEEHFSAPPGTEEARLLSRTVMVADHVMVKRKAGVSQADLQAEAEQQGGTLLRWIGAGQVALLRFDQAEKTTVDTVYHALLASERLASVSLAEPDYVVHTMALPDDPGYADTDGNFSGGLWGLHNEGGTHFLIQDEDYPPLNFREGLEDADIDAPEAWARYREILGLAADSADVGSHDVVVGVIDTGIDYSHPDLAANMWVNPGEIAGNGIDDDGNGYIDDVYGWDFHNEDADPMDDHSHGTHCAGTIGGVGDNGIGVVGVSWKVSMMAIKFLGGDGSGFTSDAIACVEYATMMNVDLTSNSWGGGGGTQIMLDTVQAARDAGQLFVAAAGNSSNNNDETPNYPSNYGVWSDNVIAVMASEIRDDRAYFSSYGKDTVHLAAPGRVTWSSVSPNSSQSQGQSDPSAYLYDQYSGTSMATPHVSGALALLKSAFPSISMDTARQILLASVDEKPQLAEYCSTGGRLNVDHALEAVQTGLLLTQAPVVDDDNQGASSGNDDGLLNPGETVEWILPLKNVSDSDLTGVTATLSGGDSYVTVVSGSVSYPDLPAFSEGVLPTLVPVLSVDANTPDEHSVILTYTLQADGGKSWVETLELVIYEGAVISGTVRVDGAGASGFTVIARAGGQLFRRENRADGSYSIGVLPGDYEVYLAAREDLYQSEVPRVVSAPESGVDFNLSLASLSGTVSDADTALGIPGAEVVIRGDLRATLQTDEDGHYSWNGLLAGSFEVGMQARKKGLYLPSQAGALSLPLSQVQDFVLEPGYFNVVNLGSPDEHAATAIALNDHGVCVGYSFYVSGFSETRPKPFVWDAVNGLRSLDLGLIQKPAGDTDADYYSAAFYDINNHGVILGEARQGTRIYDAFIYHMEATPGGDRIQALPQYSGQALTGNDSTTQARHINDAGTIAGSVNGSVFNWDYSGGCRWSYDKDTGVLSAPQDFFSVFDNNIGYEGNVQFHPEGLGENGQMGGWSFRWDNSRNYREVGVTMAAGYTWSDVEVLRFPAASEFPFETPDRNCKTFARGAPNSSGYTPGNLQYIHQGELNTYEEPVIFNPGGSPQRMGQIGGGTYAYLVNINESGRAVGWANTGAQTYPSGFRGIMAQNYVMDDFNLHLPAHLDSQLVVQELRDITDAGSMSGMMEARDSNVRTACIIHEVLIDNAAPMAALSATPLLVAPGEEVRFDASGSSNAEPNDVLQYQMDFADGHEAQSAGPEFRHAFSDPGEYVVVVTVTDGYGLQDSASVTVQVQGAALPPAAPSALTVTALSSSTLRLNWTDNSLNESAFILQAAASASGPWVEVNTTAADTVEVEDSGLNPDTERFYRVFAEGSGGRSPASSVASGRTWTEQQQFFADAGLPHDVDPTLDSDGDGLRNEEEYEAGTHPNLKASVLMIHSITGNLQFMFPSVQGKYYRVSYRNQLATGNWIVLGGYENLSGTGGDVQVSDSSSESRFYRVEVKGQPW